MQVQHPLSEENGQHKVVVKSLTTTAITETRLVNDWLIGLFYLNNTHGVGMFQVAKVKQTAGMKQHLVSA